MAFETHSELLAFTVADLPTRLRQEASEDHKALHTFYNAAVLVGQDVDTACITAIRKLQDLRHRIADYKAWREAQANASDTGTGT